MKNREIWLSWSRLWESRTSRTDVTSQHKRITLTDIISSRHTPGVSPGLSTFMKAIRRWLIKTKSGLMTFYFWSTPIIMVLVTYAFRLKEHLLLTSLSSRQAIHSLLVYGKSSICLSPKYRLITNSKTIRNLALLEHILLDNFLITNT